MQFDALKATIGQGLIAALTPVVQGLNILINKLRVAAGYFKSFMELIFGKQSSGGGGAGITNTASDVSDIAGAADDASKAVGGVGDSAKKAGDKAKKAAKGAVMSFDELHQLTKNDSSSGSGGSGGGGGGAGGLDNMGGAVDVDLGKTAEDTGKLGHLFDGLIDQLKHLKDLFAEGFKMGLGSDFEDRIENIKQSIKGIGDSLRDIFSDSAVVESFQHLLDSMALNAGKVAGSMVSIGTTIAQNLLGGINKYLEQNKDFIKQRLVGIMDATAEISDLIGNFAVAFADIFSVFGGEVGQQCTADIIAIFSNAFLGVTEMALKIGRDLLNCIVKPIVDNKDAIKTAFEGNLIALESVLGTFAQFVTDMVSKTLSVYDERVKPAFESIAQGYSNLLGKILELYNAYVVPMLQKWGADFRALYEEHLKPLFENIVEVFGKAFELVSALWQNVLEPLLEWLLSGLVPGITAGLDTVWNAVKGIVGFVADIANGIIEVLEGIIDFLTGVFTGDWGRAWEGMKEVAGGIGSLIYTLVIKSLTTLLQWVTGAFVNGWKGAVEGIKNMWQPIGQWFNSTVITPVKQFFSQLWEGIKSAASQCQAGLKAIWQVLSGWFNSSVITPIKNFFTGLWNGIKTTASTCWNGVKGAWQGATSWFNSSIITPIKTAFTTWGNNIKQIGTTAWNGVKGAWQSATSWFNSSIITPIKTGFTNAWNSIKSLASTCVSGIQSAFGGFKSFISGIISGIQSSFSSLWSNIANGCRSAINSLLSNVESGINSMVSKVNSVTSKVGVNIPDVKVPKLARGGIVDGATFMGNYIAGEAGKEMIVPLENTSFVDKLASSLGNAVMSAMSTAVNSSSGFGDNGQNVSLEMDGMTLARTITPYVVKEMKRLDIIT